MEFETSSLWSLHAVNRMSRAETPTFTWRWSRKNTIELTLDEEWRFEGLLWFCKQSVKGRNNHLSFSAKSLRGLAKVCCFLIIGDHLFISITIVDRYSSPTKYEFASRILGSLAIYAYLTQLILLIALILETKKQAIARPLSCMNHRIICFHRCVYSIAWNKLDRYIPILKYRRSYTLKSFNGFPREKYFQQTKKGFHTKTKLKRFNCRQWQFNRT